jgi:hypothetical protein
MMRRRMLGVVLLEAEHSVETLGWADPSAWEPPAGLGEGFYGHPAAWPFPVVFAVAQGATAAASARCTPEATAGVVAAVGRLDGHCDLIVGGCGYFGAAWPAMSRPPGTPTVLSALDHLDLALASTSRDVAVLSMSAGAASSFLRPRADGRRIRVIGLDHERDWGLIGRPDWVTHPRWTLEGLEKGLRRVLEAESSPGGDLDNVGGVLLECTVLPQFGSLIRDHLDVPVYDVSSIVRGMMA